MEQQTILTANARPQAERSRLLDRWMRYFFCEDISPDNRIIIDQQRRAVWIALALLLLSLSVGNQSITTIDSTWSAPFLVLFNSLLPIVLTLGSFVAMWIAFRPTSLRQQARYAHNTRTRPALWQRVVLLLTLFLTLIGGVAGVLTIVACFSPPAFSNDGTSLDTNAALLLLHGRNPYTDSSIIEVARQFGIQPNWTTPLREGQFANRLDYPTMPEFQSVFDTALKSGSSPEFESRVSYPALSFLTLVPFVFFQHYNVFPFYLLSYLLIIVVAWKCTRPEMRPWVLILAIANAPMWVSIFGGNLDIFYCLLVFLAWLTRDFRWRSTLFLGLAVASKQIAWLFVPFYFILIWRKAGFKEALYRVSVAGGLALMINLPFIIWNPHAWLAGVLAPVVDPMFPMGVGMISLSVTHLLPYFPNWIYYILEGGTELAALIVYWRICRQRPEAALVLAILPLFFAWRSLPSYFSCTAYPLFVIMTGTIRPGMSRALASSGIVFAGARGRPLFLPRFILSIMK